MFAAFMDLKKIYDRLNWTGLWNVFGIYWVDGQLLRGLKAFYKNVSASVRRGRELSALFGIKKGR